MNMLKRYARWLHGQWPAGHVERLPECREDGSTVVPGLYIVGDITGIPLLKFSSDTGARAIEAIVADPAFQRRDKGVSEASADSTEPVRDVVIIGGGVAGMAAALAAEKHGLSYEVLEAVEPFATILNFPKRKPIFTYPTDMTPAGELQFSDQANVKEALIEELLQRMTDKGITPTIAHAERVARRGKLLEVVVTDGQNRLAHRVVAAIGRSGNFRKLNVPGENLDKVSNRLHDPKDFCSSNVMVVGGGDSALETAIAIASCGGHVTVSYRKPEFSRPKPDNIDKIRALAADPMADVAVEDPVSERVTTSAGSFMREHRKPGSIRLLLPSQVKEIRETDVVIETGDGSQEVIPNDAVFTMIGREAPLAFFRRSGVPISGEWRRSTWVACSMFVGFCFWLYHWKTGKSIPLLGPLPSWLNPNAGAPSAWLQSLGGALGRAANDASTLLGTVSISMKDPSFYYTLAYTAVVGIFGIRRIRRRRTPYVKVQTLTLMAVQFLPLFLLPEIVLPLLGHNGAFAEGWLASAADQLFPIVNYGHGREYWRAYGFVLAWPLMVWNIFTDQPLWGWLIIGSIQTLVIIPLMIRKWGKGAYCGWICSCGALAETLGDTHRQKMPHGPKWNRLNMVGQVVLAWSVALLCLKILAWTWPGSFWPGWFEYMTFKLPIFNYKWMSDLFLAGVVGYGLYFWFSGRVWCRFICPLAALMHIYARFSRFRIFADKKKCISCNVCTSVCHQGIDVMNFANKGLPMEDPECVRCSACVQSCPTGVLTFGEIDPSTGDTLRTDRLSASLVQLSLPPVNSG